MLIADKQPYSALRVEDENAAAMVYRVKPVRARLLALVEHLELFRDVVRGLFIAIQAKEGRMKRRNILP